MADEPRWPDEIPAEASEPANDHVDLGLPPPLPAGIRPLHYGRPGGLGGADRGLPVWAGFMIGVALYLAVAAVWWMVARANGGLTLKVWGLAGVPAATAVLAGVLQASLGWRGVVPGACAAVGISFLIGCLGIAAICGSFRV